MTSPGTANDETEPVKDDLNVDCGGDTQQLEFDSQFSPFPGEEFDNNFDAFETQRMEFDSEAQLLNAAEETQLCEFDEEEAVGIRGGDAKGAVDLDSLDDSGSLTRSSGNALTDVTCSSGSSKRRFNSLRTASFRSSALSARKKMAAKGLESGSRDVSNPSEVKSTELCNGAVDQVFDVEKTNLIRESDTNVANVDVDKHEHKGNTDDDTRGEDFGPVHVCSEDLAGLSYVNSQEPGDASQANALDFVERFLESSHCVLDLDTKKSDVAYITPNPELSAKGAQKLAKKVNVDCLLAETEVYNWVDSNEDDGGGEFLTRNKGLFFSNNSGAQKSRTERQKSINEEHQAINVHDKVMGLAQSEMFEALDVGVDTQMAAEAIEALSNGLMLAKEGETAFEGEGCGDGQMKNKMEKDSDAKHKSMRKRGHPSDLGVTTRFKQAKRTRDQVGDEFKLSVPSETRSKNARKKVVKGKATSQMQNNEKVANTNVKGKPDKRTLKVQGEVSEGTQEKILGGNGSIPAKKQRIEENINTVAPIASRTQKNMLATINTTASESCDDPQRKANQLREVDADGSERKINNGETDAIEKALKLTTMTDGAIHSDKLACSGGNLQNTSVQLSRNGKSKVSLQESVRHAEGRSITRQRRSKRRVPSSKHDQPILSSNENNAFCLPSAEKAQPECPTQGTPEMEKASLSACSTPANCRTSINTASPVCMGDEYYKLSCKKNMERSSLMKERNSLTPFEPKCSLSDKGLRKRRDMASVRVVFSNHLDKDIIRHQKKILARLGVPSASSMLDGTHFIADEFARTRNMLEAIAHGKSVVNHLWIESCGQAGCYIDERNYILRDTKKEKELGFSMPVSLARATQHPLLEGRRVLITPSTKPGVEILSSLVKAVLGQAFERICRSIYKDDKLRDDLLVLSCEEDYEFCMPLLEKGAEVYSSELLLNGIIIQKLEFERHRLFFDHVKRTRSTIWLKKDGNEFCPVSGRM